VRNLAEGIFSRTLLAVNDRLLIGTVDEGIVEVRLDASPRFTPANDLEPRGVTRLVELRGVPFALTADALYERGTAGGIWNRRIAMAIGTWTDRNVSALSMDPTGKLWIGYFDRGLDIVAAGRSATHVEDDQVFCINRIVTDSERNIQLVATANGLVLFNLQGGVARRMTQADGLISSHVTDVAVQSNGFAVATAAGVTFLDAAGPQSVYAFHGLANNHVYSLAANGGKLLAGTLGGLSLIENGFVRASYTTANSRLKQNWISAIVPYRDGWFVGTYGAGIFHLDRDGQWTDFPDMPQKTVINPNAMLVASGRIFAGTLTGGLLIYDPASRRWTPFTEGLPSLSVTALASSVQDVFIGTDNGIVRMPLEGFRR
jgi:ligand-binding sensor domain-containing protein